MKRGSTGRLRSGAVALGLLLGWAHGCSNDENGTMNGSTGSGGIAGSGGASAGGGNANGGTVGKGGSTSKGGGAPGGEGGDAAGADAGAGSGDAGAGAEAGAPSSGGTSGSSGSGGTANEGGAAGQGGARGIDCSHSVDCVAPAEPVCDNGYCVAGTDECTADDASDPLNDGPAGAVSLNGDVGVPVMIGGTVCSRPIGEADYFVVTVPQGAGVSLSIDWVGNADLDLQVVDGNGVVMGVAGPQHPAAIQLSYLPAGNYYVRVTRSGPSNPASTDYTITSVRTPAAVCTSRADCAVAYGTQFYRASCSGGVCTSISAANVATGSPCDSDDDCQSGLCSYQAFESDAAKSVCTIACTSTPDCASLGAGFRCTTGPAPNRCVPSCTTDLECGANTASQSPDASQPWEYWNCDVGTGSCGS
jgi:Bacterial pre-peptidase C-terminal domain